MKQTEYLIQRDLIKWLRLKYPKALFCASAGGLHTSRNQAVKMKSAGYVKGFPDLFIYEPSRGFNGLAIELKAENGTVSPEQTEWIQALNARGYYATVCKGFDEAAATIQSYFSPIKLKMQ